VAGGLPVLISSFFGTIIEERIPLLYITVEFREEDERGCSSIRAKSGKFFFLFEYFQKQWRAWGDSNARPLVPETSALSN
jgi:hypothetical protein